jgi:hypothetical protein
MTDISGGSDCLHLVTAHPYAELVQRLKRDKVHVIEIESGETVEELFQALKAQVPMDPPIGGTVNWDALSDSLWAGLDGIATPVALAWKDAWKLKRHDPQSFQTAEEILRTICTHLSSGSYGARRKSVQIILASEP